MDISIIIVNYNVKYFLEQCLYSVLKACRNIEAEVFVVDNNSTDGSRHYLENKFPAVVFQWNHENPGFAKANNIALKRATGKTVLFLNPDTILPEDCLEKCLAYFDGNALCGALGVRMIDGSGRFLRESKRSFPSPATAFFKMAGLSSLFPTSRLFSKYYAGHLPEDRINEVEVLAGAFFMARKNVLDGTGGFDEAFFMYAEDIDLSYRILNSGFKNYYFPDTTIVHFKGESTQRKSNLYISRFYGAMQLFVKKHYSNQTATLWLMKLAIGSSRIISMLKLSLKNVFQRGRKRDENVNNEALIITDQPYFNEIIQLVKHATNPLIIQGRISISVSDNLESRGHIADLHHTIIKNKTGKIIFCEPVISYKEMIRVMQLHKGEVDFLFHSKGSDSIIGSNSKNENGIFISDSNH